MSNAENKFKSEPVNMPEPVASVNCERPGDIEWYDAGKMSDGADLYSHESVRSLVARLEVANSNWQNMRGCLAAAEEDLDKLRNAALEVLKARDEDDVPTGHPNHCHEVPGVWDTTGLPCHHCAAYTALEGLLPKEQTVVTLNDWLIRTPTSEKLLFAAETFFDQGTITMVNDTPSIRHGWDVIPWQPLQELEHCMHLAAMAHIKVFYDKGGRVQFTDLADTGEVVRQERVVLGSSDTFLSALMRKVCQVAVYLAKRQKLGQ